MRISAFASQPSVGLRDGARAKENRIEDEDASAARSSLRAADAEPSMDTVTLDTDWRRPVRDPDRWCYPCFTAHPPQVQANPMTCAAMSRPWNGQRVLSGVLFDALADLGIPRLLDGWRPAHIQAIRALIAEFQWRIDFAEEEVHSDGAGPQCGDENSTPVVLVASTTPNPPVAPASLDHLTRQ